MTSLKQPLDGSILVTGADKGIGAEIVKRAAAQGLPVVALLEGSDGSGPLSPNFSSNDNVRVCRGNLTEAAFLAESFRGVRACIHTVFDCNPRTAYEELATTGLNLSRRLFEAASEAGCDAFVLVTRARICATSDRYIDEESEVHPNNACEQALHDTELLLTGLAERQPEGTRLFLLRSAPMYGHDVPPSSAVWLALPPLLGLYFELVPGVAGGPRCHFVHVADVAAAALHLSSYRSSDIVEIFHVADDTPLTIGEFFNLVIEAYGLTLGVKVPTPSPALIRMLLPVIEQPLVLSAADAMLSRFWGYTHEPSSSDLSEEVFTPSLQQSSFSELFEEAFFNNDRLKSTGFELEHPDVRASLGDVIAGYQRQGYLPEGRAKQAPEESGRPLLSTVFNESLKGTFRRTGSSDTDHLLELDVTMTSQGLHIPFRDHVWNLDGQLEAEGLATDASVTGTLDLSLFGKKRLTYEFGFTGDDGEKYRVVGVKAVRYRDIAKSLSQMEVRILDASGGEAATGSLVFNLRRELLGFFRSFRVELG